MGPKAGSHALAAQSNHGMTWVAYPSHQTSNLALTTVGPVLQRPEPLGRSPLLPAYRPLRFRTPTDHSPHAAVLMPEPLSVGQRPAWAPILGGTALDWLFLLGQEGKTSLLRIRGSA